MPEQNGQHIIQTLRSKWQRNYLFGALMLALAASLLLGTVLKIFAGTPWWLIAAVFLVSAMIVYWLRPFRKVADHDITSFLNRNYPQLEESSHLLLMPADSLNLLQQLQKHKIESVITQIPAPTDMLSPVKKAGMALFTVTAICVAAFVAHARLGDPFETKKTSAASQNNPSPDIIPAGIQNFTITIQPPVYTKQKKREQEQFTLKVEEGSNVEWIIHTTKSTDSLHLIFNNKETLLLKRSATDSNEWRTQRIIKEPGFYQIRLPGTSSALYTLEVIHDQPADIRILTPQQYTTIEPGRKAVSNLRVHISDDYGITHAEIMATKASGKGESVSFKEQQLSFPVQFSGQKEIELTKLLDLSAMGMQGGDELYFYIKARDSHNQESRSDMYFISLPDTSELLNMSGMESGINEFPEYFRSQRQIIIDTEKLLKEQSSVSKDTFNTRSDQLGVEQKLLRLRYGKFLGEENESGGGGHSADDGHDHGSEPAYGDVQSLIDQYAHKHDNAEDATYFEPEQKAQLKAILTEMWNSELKLRTYIPAEALPYQYKALRLLKDLQQKSRAYVSKTSVKMPPLKPEKRLTGNLEKIIPANEPARETKDDQYLQQLKNAVHLLEMLKNKQHPAIEEHASLLAAEKAISAKAITEPSVFLPALNAVRSVVTTPASASKQEILTVQRALQQILQTATELPQRTSVRKEKLSDYYFKKLSE